MTLPNSILFFILGTIMRMAPVVAPELVMPGATSVEMSARGLWLVVMGYFIGGIGAAYLLKATAQLGAQVFAEYSRRAAAIRMARQTAHDREARARAVAARMTVRVES